MITATVSCSENFDFEITLYNKEREKTKMKFDCLLNDAIMTDAGSMLLQVIIIKLTLTCTSLWIYLSISHS